MKFCAKAGFLKGWSASAEAETASSAAIGRRTSGVDADPAFRPGDMETISGTACGRGRLLFWWFSKFIIKAPYSCFSGFHGWFPGLPGCCSWVMHFEHRRECVLHEVGTHTACIKTLAKTADGIVGVGQHRRVLVPDGQPLQKA